MKIHAYASESHYAAHLAPILAALPDDIRGRMFASRATPWGGPPQSRMVEPVMVASFADACAGITRAVPIIHVEHGAGQTYDLGDGKTHPSYAGGRSPAYDRVRLFLTPGDHGAQRWRDAYPDTPAVAVGCPRLDPWHLGRRRHAPVPVVAFAFHSDLNLVPETRSALRWYLTSLERLRTASEAGGWVPVGHGHPRAWRHLEGMWRRLGVEAVPDFADVLDIADVLVADNSSVLYEFSSTGRPVICLNAPWYRRDTEHGMRFWNLVPGVQVDHPDGLYPAIRRAVDEPWHMDTVRSRVSGHVYARRDGTATAAAVAAIMEVARGL